MVLNTTTQHSSKVCGLYSQLPQDGALSPNTLEAGKRIRGDKSRTSPLISIVTVVRNNVGTISRCLDSVLCQSFKDYELIVIDGASSDGTLDIIRDYSDSLDYLVSEPDQGIYFAMNKGLSLAKGSFILFLNSDDWLPDSKTLESVAKHLDKNTPSVVYGRANYYNGSELKHISFDVMHHENLFSKTTSLPHQATYIHSDLYDALGGFNTSYSVAADAIWSYRAKSVNCEFKFVDDVWVNYSVGGYSNENSTKARLELLTWSFRNGVCDAEYVRGYIEKTQGLDTQEQVREYCKHLDKSFEFLDNFLNTVFQSKRTGVLVANDDRYNHYNSYLESSLNLVGYDVKFSSAAFFAREQHRLVIIEWPEYLLVDKHHQGCSDITERVNRVIETFKYYQDVSNVISIVHNDGSHGNKFNGDQLLLSAEDRLQREIYQRSDAVFHLGEFGRELFTKRYQLSESKQFVLPHFPYSSYPTVGSKIGSRQSLDLPLNKKIVACIGAVRSIKEVRTTIEIFKGLEDPKAILVVVGRCSEEHSAVFKRELNDRVLISNGYVPDNDIGNYLSASDIVLITRLNSLNSGVLFLAVSLARPVLIADSGNSSEFSHAFGFEIFRTSQEGVVKLNRIADKLSERSFVQSLTSNSQKLFDCNGIDSSSKKLSKAFEATGIGKERSIRKKLLSKLHSLMG